MEAVGPQILQHAFGFCKLLVLSVLACIFCGVSCAGSNHAILVLKFRDYDLYDVECEIANIPPGKISMYSGVR